MSSDFADQYQWCFAAGICFRIFHEIEKDHLLNWRILWLVLYKSNYKCHQWSAPSTVPPLLIVSSIFWHSRRSSQACGHPAQCKAITLRDFKSNWRRDIHLGRMRSIGFKIRSLLCLCEKQLVWLMCVFVVLDELCLFELFLFLVAGANCGSCIMFWHSFFWTNQWHPTTHHPTSNDTSLGGILQDCDLVRLVNDYITAHCTLLYYCTLYSTYSLMKIEDRCLMMMMPPEFF